jgi:hypothetical protein
MQTTARGRVGQGKRPRRSRGEWLAEVVRWRSSGQKADVYARAHGLHAGTLAFWASRLRGEMATVGRRSAGNRGQFLPVRVVPQDDVTLRVDRSANRSKGSLAADVEVVLTNGRRVRMSAVGEEALGLLLDAVEGRRSC